VILHLYRLCLGPGNRRGADTPIPCSGRRAIRLITWAG